MKIDQVHWNKKKTNCNENTLIITIKLLHSSTSILQIQPCLTKFNPHHKKITLTDKPSFYVIWEIKHKREITRTYNPYSLCKDYEGEKRTGFVSHTISGSKRHVSPCKTLTETTQLIDPKHKHLNHK